jgi:transposase
MILDEVRAHVLAGRKLPTVWVPNPQTRDDREAVRLRLALGEQRTQIKNQIRSLAKRTRLKLPEWFSKSGNWSRRSVQWLRDVATGELADLQQGIRVALASLLDLYAAFTDQLKTLDKTIAQLAKTSRYAKAFRKLKLLSGVGTLTAMVFLTEIGDLNRFANRRQLAAYLGLAPAAFESGDRDDRKGRITRQGPSQLRHVLCQAAWAAIRCSEKWKGTYERIKRGTPKRSKIAIVAVMRQLGIAMWQTARSPDIDQLIEEIDQRRKVA